MLKRRKMLLRYKTKRLLAYNQWRLKITQWIPPLRIPQYAMADDRNEAEATVLQY